MWIAIIPSMFTWIVVADGLHNLSRIKVEDPDDWPGAELTIEFHLRRLRSMVETCPIKDCESCWGEAIEIYELEKLVEAGQTTIDYSSWFETVIEPILNQKRDIDGTTPPE